MTYSYFAEAFPFLAGLLIGIGISWLYRYAVDNEESYERRYDPDHPSLRCLRGGLDDDDERREGAG